MQLEYAEIQNRGRALKQKQRTRKQDQRRKIVSQHRSELSKNVNTHKLQLLVQRAVPTKPVLK